MAILDSITEARRRGADDDIILQNIIKSNPRLQNSFQQAQQRGANSSRIVDEIMKQNQKPVGKTGILGFGVGLAKGIAETLGKSVFGVRPGITGLAQPIFKDKEVLKAKTPAERAGKITETVAEFTLGGGIGIKTGFKIFQIARESFKRKAIETIRNLIAPKITARESRQIISESRVTRGKDSFLFGQRPDVVIQSKQVERAADTINRRIPGAEKMNDFTLNNRLKIEIGSIGRNLKPQMKQVNVSPEITNKALDSWSILKKAQAKSPDFVAFPGASRFQKNFEGFLGLIAKRVKGETGQFRQRNLDDLWDIRIRYDRSIPTRVKQATDQSPAALQLQKEMWLENRAILNSIINNTSSGLGRTSQKAFSQMSDLYMARQNIATKSKILTERKPGLVSLKNLFRFGIGVGGVTLLGREIF